MDVLKRVRGTIISTIIRDIPGKFWEDARAGTRRVYADSFEQIRADPNVVKEQRIDKLYQDRHFYMESLLQKLAHVHGLECSSTILIENGRSYVYATKGAVGLTQAYVPSIGTMPKPARFRERHAALNSIPKAPRLELGDEPREVMLGKDCYGVLVHNPAGKRFSDQDQRLGMIQFCVPYCDCSGWAIELSIEEILYAYDAVALVKKKDRRLPWKKDAKQKGDQE